MEEKFVFTEEEKHACEALTKEIHEMLNDTLTGTDVERLRTHIHSEIEARHIERDRFGLNPVLKALMTAKVAVGDIGLRRDSLLAIMLYESVLRGHYDTTLARKDFGEGVATILQGLVRVQELYSKTPIVESENFRNLLLSFAEDMRVVLIMIADRVCLMRQIRDTPNKEAQHEVAEEASYLYAPLAHKLGLYQLKSELEDLSLKYLEHDAYYLIKEKLNATKRSRDAYIERFIGPVSKHLTEAGLKFHIKGRTKSIHSIWQKMKKQKCGVDGIYDLFAIRIILDSPLEKEKMQCWQAYSIVTDMYQPNPKRLRDWISVPKSNGYECLHITVLGPEQKWVEVQIRTERMDEVAEHGLAAHWRYKGVKADGGGMEEWLASIRTALEAGDNLEVMDQFKLDLYEDEVYAFTPKGDLLKFPKGATVLDFAYHIHSRVGDTCVGGKVNGKNVSFRTPLHSGDTVEILTASNQTPKPEWLRILVTSRARAKLRLSLKETRQKQGLYAKELLERRLKNKKLDYDEATVAHLIRKMGFKEQSDFYHQIAEGASTPPASSTNTRPWLTRARSRSAKPRARKTSSMPTPPPPRPRRTTTCSSSTRASRASTSRSPAAATPSMATRCLASSPSMAASRSTVPTAPTPPRCSAASATASSVRSGAARAVPTTTSRCASSATTTSASSATSPTSSARTRRS